MSAIEVKSLVKKFHGQTVLHGIDLEVQKGEVVAIIGPSGSGKTTLLRSINLLEQPESGTIRVGDVTIDAGRSLGPQKGLIRQLRQHVGFVFQNFNLFPHRTVLENIIEGPVIVKGEDKQESMARARELLAKVGLSGKENSYPRRLSGGQQQRVAIARALAMRPDVILFDEPTFASSSRARAMDSCLSSPFTMTGPSIMFSSTVRWGNRLKFWKTKPTCWRSWRMSPFCGPRLRPAAIVTSPTRIVP
ncbi:ATP-binding cassette domain-containing protein, partial [Klebsiella pneumoniae]|uniref:ATP-binding cassette domain-containing protein n=1 Tax=Klebsiella pneumoniae TaxID=573 RepID=UPI001CED472E